MQAVDFLARFGGFLFRAAHANDGLAVEAAEVREVGVEDFLLLGELEELGFRGFLGVGGVKGVDEGENGKALLADFRGGLEDGKEEGIGDHVVCCHFDGGWDVVVTDCVLAVVVSRWLYGNMRMNSHAV